MQYPSRRYTFLLPTSNKRTALPRRLVPYCALILLALGCAAQPHEHGKAADSLATTNAVEAPTVPSNTPVTPPVPTNTLADDSVKKERSVDGSVAPNRAADAKTTSERKRGAKAKPAAASHESTTSKSGAAAAPAAAPANRPIVDESEAQPAYAEPPELARALAEFESQWEALSTSRACGDACRAFESMRRSAQKICDLVLDGDPKARCPTARARLEQASRDLSERCSTCR